MLGSRYVVPLFVCNTVIRGIWEEGCGYGWSRKSMESMCDG